MLSCLQLKAAVKSNRLRSLPAHARGGGGGGGAGSGLGPSDSAADDLRREVDVMRALSHPNLVRLFEVIDDREGGKVGG